MASANPIANAVAKAKSTLARANKDFPSSMAPESTRAKSQTLVAKARPISNQGSDNTEGMAGSLKFRADQEKALGMLPKMHKGGKVPGKPGEEVPIMAEAGETVIPADKAQRQSEYRKVYLARRQKRGEGGNSPAEGEKHDQKKATKGLADKKA